MIYLIILKELIPLILKLIECYEDYRNTGRKEVFREGLRDAINKCLTSSDAGALNDFLRGKTGCTGT